MLDCEARRRFSWKTDDLSRASAGEKEVISILDSLLKDWGAFLELSLYEGALIHFLGGESSALKSVPIIRGEELLGGTPMVMADADCAIRLSAVTNDARAMGIGLQRLLKHTRLRRLLWINFNHHVVEVRGMDRSSLK